jgi:hypothetical protein
MGKLSVLKKKERVGWEETGRILSGGEDSVKSYMKNEYKER